MPAHLICPYCSKSITFDEEALQQLKEKIRLETAWMVEDAEYSAARKTTALATAEEDEKKKVQALEAQKVETDRTLRKMAEELLKLRAEKAQWEQKEYQRNLSNMRDEGAKREKLNKEQRYDAAQRERRIDNLSDRPLG